MRSVFIAVLGFTVMVILIHIAGYVQKADRPTADLLGYTGIGIFVLAALVAVTIAVLDWRDTR